MPTIALGPTPGSECRVVPPGRVRMELAELVARAQAADLRLPFDTEVVEQALEAGADGPRFASDEARRAWHARLSPDTPPAEDVVADLIADQVDRIRAAVPDRGPDADAAHAAMLQALGVVAAPEALLEVELGLRRAARQPETARAWVAVRGEVAVSLGTESGAQFELSWGGIGALPEMLAHLLRLPAQAREHPAAELPVRFTMPVELLAAAEVVASRHREDLLPALVERFPGAITGADQEPYDAARGLALLHEVREQTTARLRVMVAGTHADGQPVGGAGLVVWIRLDEQWYALDPDMVAGVPVGRASAVTPRDLARSVGPVLARVLGRDRQPGGDDD